MSRFPCAAWTLPLVLTMGCASTAPDPAKSGHVVDGQGTAADRSAIQSTNEQIYNAEHSLSNDSGTPASAPNANIP